MADDKYKTTINEPHSVVIALDDRVNGPADPSRSRRSSSSTSSFEDLHGKGGIETPRRLSEISAHSPKSQRSQRSRHSTGEAATVDVGSIDVTYSMTSAKMASTGTLKGPQSFKTTSLEDPQFYAQTTSPSHSNKYPHANIHLGNRNNKGNRDPENVNDVVKIKFEEIFAEPEGTYSFGTIWGASHKLFTDSKVWCYKFLSALCGVPCALCWGVHFACLSFCQIWYYQPSSRSFSIQIRPCARMFGVFVRAFIEPCFAALGKIFSGIQIQITRQ